MVSKFHAKLLYTRMYRGTSFITACFKFYCVRLLFKKPIFDPLNS